MVDVVILGGPRQLVAQLVAGLALRGERPVHVDASLARELVPTILRGAHAVISMVGDAGLVGALVTSVRALPEDQRPLVLIEASGDGAARAAARRICARDARVVLICGETSGIPLDDCAGLILHALHAWDLVGMVTREAAERSGYRFPVALPGEPEPAAVR